VPPYKTRSIEANSEHTITRCCRHTRSSVSSLYISHPTSRRGRAISGYRHRL